MLCPSPCLPPAAALGVAGHSPQFTCCCGATVRLIPLAPHCRCGGTRPPTRCAPRCGCCWPTSLPTCPSCSLPPPTSPSRVGSFRPHRYSALGGGRRRAAGNVSARSVQAWQRHVLQQQDLQRCVPSLACQGLCLSNPSNHPASNLQSWTPRCASCSTSSRAAPTSWACLTPRSGAPFSPVSQRWAWQRGGVARDAQTVLGSTMARAALLEQ